MNIPEVTQEQLDELRAAKIAAWDAMRDLPEYQAWKAANEQFDRAWAIMQVQWQLAQAVKE